MIKFIDKAFIRGVLFTQGMIAEFDALTESDLIAEGDAVVYSIDTGSSVENAVNAQFADTATYAINAQNAVSAQSALTANTATSATTATTATSAQTAETAVLATLATSATTAGHANTADTATTAGSATTAATATTATTAEKASALLLNSSGELAEPILGTPVEAIAASAVARTCLFTGVDEILDEFVILAGTLGVNSILQIEPLWTFTNSANNKIIKIKIGGVQVYSATRTTSVKEAPLIVLANRNSLSSQIQPYDNTYATAGATAPATYTIDFSVNTTVEILGQRANSGDALTLEYYRVLHLIGA